MFISLVEQQFVVANTIHQTKICALLHTWVTNTPSVKMLHPQKNCLSLYFHKDTACLCFGLLNIGYVFSVSRTTVYRWVMTNCHFMSDMLLEQQSTRSMMLQYVDMLYT
jgi:hypothetical protein